MLSQEQYPFGTGKKNYLNQILTWLLIISIGAELAMFIANIIKKHNPNQKNNE